MINLISSLIGLTIALQGELITHPIPFVQAETIETPVVLTIEQKIAQYDWNDDIAIAVARAESGLNPQALNPEWHKSCQGSRGVFQLACIHHPENPDELFNEDFNIKKAYELYSKEGWRPWTTYTSGKYLEYMK